MIKLTAWLVLTFSYCLATGRPVLARENKPVEACLVIKASPEEVFEHIKLSRTQEPSRRKLVSQQNNIAVIEEQFDDLPIIGKGQMHL
ncbi:MAG: hypothetical protein IPK73_12945 [Candidatus Obscuribacter sp.]|nr:hypothetical protein [Candidatus Obscuribacter sp.]